MSNKKGLLALSPLFLLIVLIVAFTVYSVDASHKDTNLSLTVAFMISSIYAIAISGGMPIKSRVDTYSKGAGANNLMLMLWIYVLAGSFAASAKAMGAVDATVNLALSILPASMILPGLFLAACFISVSIGTSVGTVVALVPIAAGLAHSMDVNTGMMTAIIVGGAYFGDNLSFISDTTVVATQTQNCKMSDKFRVNSLIVVPAAVIVLAIYAVMGIGLQAPTDIPEVEYVKVLPYLVVLVTAVAGMNVMAVLTMGTLLCGVIGVSCQLLGATGGYDLFGWFSAMGNGIIGMGELVIIAMMAGGMLEIIRENGGINYIIDKITAHVRMHKRFHHIYGIAIICMMVAMFVFSACSPSHKGEVDELNYLSYALHYRNLDSTKVLAEKALALSEDYPAGYAEACNNLAFVAIAKMDYHTAKRWLDKVNERSDNQIELLIADVQNMRLCQREARNKDFYSFREKAIRKLRRIGEEIDNLPLRERHRAIYAKSEFDIVAATYFYYVQLDKPMLNALADLDPDEVEQDTAQYLNYLYNMGAGGAITHVSF